MNTIIKSHLHEQRYATYVLVIETSKIQREQKLNTIDFTNSPFSEPLNKNRKKQNKTKLKLIKNIIY